MNQKYIDKQLTKIEDRIFTEEEMKENYLQIKEPYWLIKSKCYLSKIPIFGIRSELQRRLETFSFFSFTKDINLSISKIQECKKIECLNFFEKKYGKANTENKYFYNFDEKSNFFLFSKNLLNHRIEFTAS